MFKSRFEIEAVQKFVLGILGEQLHFSSLQHVQMNVVQSLVAELCPLLLVQSF